jgi:beta-glucanase (GH16 family)
MTYGRYAVRLKADALPGYETAWLLWPDSNVWPRDGEINFPEGYLDGKMCAFLHHMYGTWAGDQDAICSTVTYTSWHTVVLEWGPTVTNFYIDGNLIMSSTTRIPSSPMHWVLQTDTDPCCQPSNTTAGNVQIDWVAAWKPA